ncbi:MAG: putative repeat protein (TIGR01451 family), partial [Crocinitomix sp.]
DVKQHLNIFCILKENKGEVIMDTVSLPTAAIGEIISFTSTVKNTGSDTVTLRMPDDPKFTNYLDQYPVKLAPKTSRILNFEVNTSSFPNRYDKKVFLKTNVNEKHVMSVPIKGEVIAPNRADIYFPKKTLRLDVEYGGPTIYNFWYYNTGDMPLIISMCKGSCGCLVPSCSREPLAPGDSAVVNVKYDSKRVGPINKSVSVTSNAVTKRIILRVTGSVAPRPSDNALPDKIDMQDHNLKFDSKKRTINLRFNEHKTAVFNFTNEGIDPVKIHIPSNGGSMLVRHSENTIPPGGTGWISARFDARRVGEFTRKISIGVNGVYYYSILELNILVREENAPLPLGPVISFDRTEIDTIFEYGADAKFEFPFTNIGSEPLIISQGKSRVPVTNIPKAAVFPGEKGVIKVKYDAKRIGNFKFPITLTHNATEGSTVLYIRGTINPKNVEIKKERETATSEGPQITFELDSIYREMEFSGDGNQTFKFTNTGDEDLFITLLKPSGSMVAHCTRSAIKPGESGVIYVKYNTRRYGPFRKTITVNHNAEDGRSVLRFVGSVAKERDTISIVPRINTNTLLKEKVEITSTSGAQIKFESQLLEQNFRLNEKVAAEFTCHNSGNESLTISKIITDNGGINNFQSGIILSGQKRTIRITYPINKIGPFDRTIVVYHTASDKPIILKFKGVIL